MIDYFLESSLCFAIFYGFYALCLKEDSFLQRNRYYLLLSSGIALLLPLLEITLPGDSSGRAVPLNLEGLSIQVGAYKGQIIEHFDFFSYWPWLYFGVAFFFFMQLLYRFWRLRKVIRTSTQEPMPGYLLIKTAGKLPTFSFFNFLFWDETQELSPEEEEKILHHELKHIHDRHSYDIIYFEVLKIIFWFNPAIFWFSRALRNNHEYIADASVLRHSDPKSYQKLMVQRLFQQLNLRLAHNFNQTEVRARIKRIDKRPTPYFWNLKMVFIIPLLTILLFAFAGKPAPYQLKPLEKREENRFANADGGLDQFYAELQKHIIYPKSLVNEGIEGTVYIQFTVEVDGRLSEVKILKSLHPLCDKIAKQAVLKAKTIWLPARVNGKNVRQSLSIPINFSI